MSVYYMRYILVLFSLLIFSLAASDLNQSLLKITNFHFVSVKLASSGLIDLDDYECIKKYGLKL